MYCPSCRHENREDAAFCELCGARLALVCSRCQTSLRPSARFCDACGESLAETSKPAPLPGPLSYTPRHLTEKILTSRSALEGERKTITALFADIKGSMDLLEDLDPEEARRLIDPALQIMMDAVHRYEGYVAQSMGDGIFALFGAPIAHEDHAQRALYAALLMQEEIGKYGHLLQVEKGIRLPIRVGVNTGVVIVRSIRKDDLHTDYVPIGHSTSLAARMESLATPGSIVVCEHTYKLTEGYFQFKALGPVKVKGVTEPVEIYEVTGLGALRTRLQVAARRGLVRFVGRGQQLEQMRQAWESAKRSHGQIVAVTGEAGVGKSRLLYEFKVPLEPHCLMLETFSVSHGKAHAYLPLIELLKGYFRITLQDDERRRLEKITGKVLTLDRTLEDTLPYLSGLLGIAEPSMSLAQMDPQIRRQRTLDAIERLLLRESLNRPLILIFEDLHWIDGETQAFLDSLGGEIVADARILLLVNYRPEYQHGWASKNYYTNVRLDPLGRAEAEEFLRALVGDGADTPLGPLKQLILTKTEGNPFFMEEVVQTLAEEGVLKGERGGYRLDRSPKELRIPATVQGVLAARIDRLPAAEKELVETLSVIGKEFPFGLLQEVAAQPEDELHRLLSHVQAGEFIYEQPAFPEPEYTFKHALTQEVAYNSLLVERRKVLHERTAKAIERIYEYGLDAHYTDLAHHYSRTDNAQKAVEYLHLAGQQALDRSVYREAIDHLTRGLDLIETLPETSDRNEHELRLQIALGQALIGTKGFSAPEVEHAYVRAQELCQRVGKIDQLFQVLAGQSVFCVARADLEKARELEEQLLSLAERHQDLGFLPITLGALGVTSYLRGDLRQAQEHLEREISLYDPRHRGSSDLLAGADPRVASRSFATWVLWSLGYPDQALRQSQEALSLARESSHGFTLAFALCWEGLLRHLRREAQAARERAEALIALANEQGFPDWLGMGTLLQGWALCKQGQREEGIAQMISVLDSFRAAGVELGRPLCLGVLAEAYGESGEPERGLAFAAEAVDAMNRTGQRTWESYLHRVKGDLLLGLSSDNQDRAEACFREAIDIARRQSAKSWELQAVMRLSRLLRGQGKTGEARELLAETYGWFTEGFDTPDLKEAKALLDDLA